MARQSRHEVTAFLFTDLVSSTELMQRIGDDQAQRVFEAHHKFLRDTVVALGGDAIEWTGDGVMATFGSVSDALNCAIAVQRTSPREAEGQPLAVRVGLNVGEVLRQQTGSGYFGTPLVIARRLCDQASAGQILCSSTVVALVSGTRAFKFHDLDRVRLKGITEPVGVFEVSYPESNVMATAVPLRRLHDLVQITSDVIVSTNELQQVAFFSDGAEQVLEYTREEILGRPVRELYPTPEEARRVYSATRQSNTGRIANLRTTLLTKNGDQIPVVLSSSILYDDEGSEIATIGVAKDVRSFLSG